MKHVIRITKIMCGVVFACTMIPSLIWPDRAPVMVKCIAFGSLLLGGAITFWERFKIWDEVSAKWRAAKRRDRDRK